MTTPARTSRAALGMGAIAATSRAFGFVRVLVVAAVLGTTYLGNAFQAANSVSNILFELLAAGALSAVLVPTFVDLLDGGDHEGAEAVAGGVLGAAILGLGSVAILGVAAAPVVARILTLGVPEAVAEDQRALVTYLLRWFVPQVVLYGAGAIATAVLHARRRFAITAAAPIANTVVMVGCLLVFRAAAGPTPGLDLDPGERWLLVLAGTGGVVAFVGCLLVACRRSGFRLRPRLPRGDARVHAVLRQSGWGAVLHTGAGLLLGAAVVAGAAVEGGVVAYQVAWVFFLAPYAILAQPIHTAILPELVAEVRLPDLARFRTSVRWALERIGLFVLPVAAAVVALARPAMQLVSFGAAGGEGGLLAAALATLALGLYPYSAFLLLARAFYALGDSRTPGVVALVVALAGIGVMVVGATTTDGGTRIAILGLGHTVAYALGALVLVLLLRRRTGQLLLPRSLAPMAVVSAAVGAGLWVVSRRLIDAATERPALLLILVALVAVGAAAVAAGYRLTGLTGSLVARTGIPEDRSGVSV